MLQQTDNYLSRIIHNLIHTLILLEVTQKILSGDASLKSYLETEPYHEKTLYWICVVEDHQRCLRDNDREAI